MVYTSHFSLMNHAMFLISAGPITHDMSELNIRDLWPYFWYIAESVILNDAISQINSHNYCRIPIQGW